MFEMILKFDEKGFLGEAALSIVVKHDGEEHVIALRGVEAESMVEAINNGMELVQNKLLEREGA